MPAPEADVIRPWDSAFSAYATANHLTIRPEDAAAAALSEAHAARFILALLRENWWLRWRFPHAVAQGENGRFCRWICRVGPRKFGLSAPAVKKIRGAFRRQLGRRVYEVFLHDPELQRLFPWGLLPFGQRGFLAWLTTFGRADQNLSDEDILWFLHESAEDVSRGLALTYLTRPDLQQRFPAALTRRGWREFTGWLRGAYPHAFESRIPRQRPPILSPPEERHLEQRFSAAAQVPPQKIQGVNLLSHFCNPSGIQQAAVAVKAALEQYGLETSCRDVPVPRKDRPIRREEWLGLELYSASILNHAPTPYFVSGYERAGLHRRDDVYRIGYWYWELERVPDEWVEVAPLVDEIWAPTPFIAEAMRARMPRPVHDMLPGVEIGRTEEVARSAYGIPGHHCVFLFMFDLHSQLHRKNPEGLIRAFREAFRNDDAASLVIKASGGDIHAKDFAVLKELCRSENVVLIDELMSRARAYGMIAMCDCFVSLHRSEGFGLGLAEAMLLGKPVIATGYSGNLAFMNRENSMLVDFDLVEIAEDRPLYTRGNRWAEPSIAHAASYMRHVYENRAAETERARRIQPHIERLLSLRSAGRRMRQRLEQITASRGR